MYNLKEMQITAKEKELVKEIMGHNLHLKISLINLNLGSQILVFHISAQSLNTAASCGT